MNSAWHRQMVPVSERKANALPSVTVSTNYTNDTLFSFGSRVVSWMHRTNNSTGGSIAVNWTAASEDAGIMAIALNDISTAGGTILPQLYHLRQRTF